ncbi:UDP-GlcNAc:undecaprenyl-phosphate GlcNAc-1-phosphate transferase [Thiothrix caldifontis]|jgi:undecaprenyl-phosphate alpha-N-acetylglucosaminyl 1-phosphatetransferase|uniref:Undecaprenyl-phosphate alpha-N-acetylglucosaminyl 1-phosphate transferase n=1 Tax=Thiothrix caldifontis TaxID=525918 RepID=A0A1H3VU79_9GAMM|nr:UDP-N-acetylglucosamine--undecaprenyl-phosphate N-acetylglucosaminephosphotransferase [Thiothrix caldifontis]SDZ78241.1 UDP-GlcNAc:undecaprenyl-phosphate GlcNAc-1-phosphate transferase [Thiothrix caldifontis]
MLILSLITSLCVTWIALHLLKPVAYRAHLLDIPQGRKQHIGAVPLIGGISVFLGVSAAVLLTVPNDVAVTTWLLCALGIVLLGVADDAEDLSVKLRIAMQITLTLALCIGSGVSLANLGNLLGLGEIDLGVFSYPFTVLIVLGVINAFNMIDGIDGLLGSVALVSLLSLVMLFGLSTHAHLLSVSVIFVAALVPYLLNNLVLPPFKEKIFMGDAGSMLIGLTISWLLIEGTQDTTQQAFRPVTALWLIALPLMDMVRVILVRLRDRRSPFAAGRDHLHHLLLNIGMSKGATLLTMAALAAVLASVGILTEYLQTSASVMFYGFLLTFLAYLLMVAPLVDAEKGSLKNWLEAASLTQTARKILARYGNN